MDTFQEKIDVVVGDAAGVGVGEGAGDAEEGRHLAVAMDRAL